MEPAECKLVLVLLFPVLPNETSYVELLLNAVVLTLVELYLLAQLLEWLVTVDSSCFTCHCIYARGSMIHWRVFNSRFYLNCRETQE